jgi:hypothetical protein
VPIVLPIALTPGVLIVSLATTDHREQVRVVVE